MENQNNDGRKIDTVLQSKNQVQQHSASSSPSHEFSFTFSLHPSKIPDKNANSTPPFAIDLSPADEIFFHGHLLPLRLLSHLPVSPRSSTNSLDSFTLPAKDILQENQNSENLRTSVTDRRETNVFECAKERNTSESKSKPKPTPLFGKSKFHVIRVVKSYVNSMRLFISFRSRKEKSYQFQQGQQTSSLSGNLLVKGKKELRGRRGGLSAPVSTRNSPTNSGHLVASETSFISSPVNKSDSTMEELQAAIQAAIAHCKKSIATTEDKINLS